MIRDEVPTPTVDRAPHTVATSPGAALPPLDELPEFRPHAVDLIGAVARAAGPWIGAGSVLGAVGGMVLRSGVGGGAWSGAVIGAFAAVAHRTPAPAASQLGSVADPLPVADETLRVMEYNVHGGMGGPGQFLATPGKLDHLAETIRREDPDIVLLQELDRFATRSTYTDTLVQLARRLDATGAVMTPGAEKATGRQEGPGVITRNGVTVIDVRGLRIPDELGEGVTRRAGAAIDAWARLLGPALRRFGVRRQDWQPFGGVPEYQPRTATDAMVRTARGNHIRVLSGHFDPPRAGSDEQARQVVPVVAALAKWPGPTVVGADFNVRDGSTEFVREHAVFAEAGLTEATAGAPENSDRIYATPHLAPCDPRKLDTPAGESPASDHAPVTVELTIRSGDSAQP
ncbi:endonuclease/exonuclease/phosphatase family protein [Williamsia sterculiae]|uniref:Metal-dependent hydrolase, endonuclease/exonuclease/phosphatase family n=1 Tax=Williamsia sterculiae TaxID=1344003 RepID=A0A1N7H3D1_9NOCA|nr:endonuclease/exonuclease/phosphatase family protein [Williamsia sterculiae]SIS19357.1 Metal-dependent hydrolase, endonuclease/exonuclease/phosphatase family [Williamsia sterculiae]